MSEIENDPQNKIPSTADFVNILAYIAEAIDPRLSPRERNEISDEIFKIDAEIGFITLVGFTSGLIHQISRGAKDPTAYIDEYLKSVRMSMGQLDLTFLEQFNDD